ncbi:rhamnosyltransferase [Paenochrobactrum gallinarii]|uniref:Rhamnosyltransferase n=1 Tax=Paenochrobactrum gallinarii TaxID=643673 RepID=A0A841LW86_9HYPH|nr:glycosyltransferase family 2 protein [Paenochrobactrum gallinarii]MBB6262635.1 rhamnosyltransferase [Paenochrobactrum gallinarii]
MIGECYNRPISSGHRTDVAVYIGSDVLVGEYHCAKVVAIVFGARTMENSADQLPLVSIIIPVKNGLPAFRTVIEMLSLQELDATFEVIIIDSGSKDGSIEAIPVDDPRFRLIEITSSDFGHGKTRNLGVKEARGEFCGFLTHDAIPLNEYWLAELIRPLRDDPEVAGVFSRHIAHQGASPFTQWELETHFTNLKQWPRVKIEDAREYARNLGLRQVYHFYSDNASCLRKSVWQEIPYPDVDFAEDQLWAKQIVEAGYTKVFAWESVVSHSHDYSIWERLQRSYDEARAFQRLFGYRLCETKLSALSSGLRATVRDLRLAIRHRWIYRYPLATIKMPFDNLARQIGYYVGSTRLDLDPGYVKMLSRDKQIQSK